MRCRVGLIRRGIVFAGAVLTGMAGCGGSAGSRPAAATTSGTMSTSTSADGGVAVGTPTGAPGTTVGSNATVGSQGTTTGSSGTSSPWTALSAPEIALIGGASLSAGGVAHAGGALHLISRGGIDVDPAGTAPQGPAIPPAPATAQPVTASMLASDVSTSGAALLADAVQAGGPDAVRHLMAGGDVFVTGTLRSADLGSARQGFDIEAPGHTVYISGTIDVSGSSGQGQSAGALTIVADQVVLSGKILAGGAGGTASGSGGAVTIKTTSALWLSGSLDTSGGDVAATGPNGAPGGSVTLTAGGDALVAGSINTRGGAATGSAGDAKGGDAGSAVVDCAGKLTWAATLDGRGGPASASGSGGTVAAGAGGTLTIGMTTAPTAILVTTTATVAGGPGAAVGGDGGSIEFDPLGGDLKIAGIADASGGDSGGQPGKGGTILLPLGSASSPANFDLSSNLTANGGSALTGSAGAVNGGAGGVIKAIQQSLTGNSTTEATALMSVNGGKAGGTGTAGSAGNLYIFTSGGDATIHGQLQARGGDAPDSGGTGGGGGLVYVFTGNGHNYMSGVLTIAPDGVIDASGGNGTVGGSARNNGGGGVNLFPTVQTDEYDVEEIAVLINSDGVHGSDRGWIDNQGKVIARGGKSNGSGGDVVYHGKQQDGNETPLPGDVENTADGSGLNGDFAGE